MKFFLLFVVFLVGKPAFSQDAPKIDAQNFVTNAVFEGLSQDKFPVALAERIMQNGNVFFVTKCPICMPTQEGFRKYLKIKTKFSKTKTPKKILQGFDSPDKTIQQTALRDLMERYVSKAYKKSNASKESLEALKITLEENRKTGMKRKKDSFGNFCPSCEGTCAPQK